MPKFLITKCTYCPHRLAWECLLTFIFPASKTTAIAKILFSSAEYFELLYKITTQLPQKSSWSFTFKKHIYLMSHFMIRSSTIQLLRFHFSFFLMPIYWFALSQVNEINIKECLADLLSFSTCLFTRPVTVITVIWTGIRKALADLQIPK